MIRRLVIGLALLAGILSATSIAAHEVRPAYLEVSQSDASHYQVLWKQPTIGEFAVRLVPHLSNGWLERAPDDQYAAAGFLILIWRIESTESPSNSTITIEGLEHTITDVLVRVRLLGRRPIDAILRPEQPRLAIGAVREANTVSLFLVHGAQHILAGADHLLFVLGLLLIVRDRRKLLLAVSAFTVAHSLTLALTLLAKVSAATQFIETMIALSILFLGVEVLRAQRGEMSLTIRYPWAVAFFFGLFHGMGFAGGLTDLGLAANELLTALLFFNLGVELGQAAFIALVLVVGRVVSHLNIARPRLLLRACAYVVGIAGAYWTLQTSATLLGVIA